MFQPSSFTAPQIVIWRSHQVELSSSAPPTPPPIKNKPRKKNERAKRASFKRPVRTYFCRIKFFVSVLIVNLFCIRLLLKVLFREKRKHDMNSFYDSWIFQILDSCHFSNKAETQNHRCAVQTLLTELVFFRVGVL